MVGDIQTEYDITYNVLFMNSIPTQIYFFRKKNDGKKGMNIPTISKSSPHSLP